MRILVLATTFPRWRSDTEPAFVYDLSRHLAARGHAMTALVPHAEGAARREVLPLDPGKSEEGQGVRVIRFPYWLSPRGQRLCYEGGALPNLRSSWTARLNLPPFLFQQWRWVGRLLREEDFDLVHVHWILPQGFFAVRHAAARSIPVVLTAHAGDVFPLQRPGLRSLLRFTVARAAAVTANSQATAEQLGKVCPELEPKIIPMGVDPGRFSTERENAQILRQTLAPGGGPLILNVGRLAPKKGQVYLLRAMPDILKKYPKARLAIVGAGPLEKELEEEIRRLNLAGSVQLLGKIPHERMGGYFAAADLFVLPSIVSPSGDTEGLGVVLLEAMAAGIPCVASNVGGIPDIVLDGDTGILVPEKQPQALAQAALELFDQPPLATRLAQSAQRRVEERFTWTSVARRFDELYRQVAQRRS